MISLTNDREKTNDAYHSKHLNDPWPEIVHNCRERNGVAQEKNEQRLAAWHEAGALEQEHGSYLF
jgi:hypothetical protein